EAKASVIGPPSVHAPPRNKAGRNKVGRNKLELRAHAVRCDTRDAEGAARAAIEPAIEVENKWPSPPSHHPPRFQSRSPSTASRSNSSLPLGPPCLTHCVITSI